MHRNVCYFPANAQERRELLRQLNEPDSDLHALGADAALGLAVQDYCSTRDELIAYARHRGLVPYLRLFLDRRGWLDDDWARRIDQLDEESRQRAN